MAGPNTRTRLIWRDGKRVRAHRWIMAQHLGRELLPTEHVHHKNGNPLDNRIENLVVMPHREHMRLHKQRYPDTKLCAVCRSMFTVNPRKRRRNKCCSSKCALHLRIEGRRIQTRKSRKSSGGSCAGSTNGAPDDRS